VFTAHAMLILSIRPGIFFYCLTHPVGFICMYFIEYIFFSLGTLNVERLQSQIIVYDTDDTHNYHTLDNYYLTKVFDSAGRHSKGRTKSHL
jgi:hypothetical protein